jgi:hypothetical protein
MPRVLPSDVVSAIDRMFPEMAQRPDAFPRVGFDYLPWLAAVVHLVQSVPNELIVLEPREYAELTASVAGLRAMADVFQASREAIQIRLRGFDQNPIAMIRRAMAACPDEAPSPGTAMLQFIGDQALRDSIRLDISAANSCLTQGDWKGTTVLAGSALEALLLWALQEQDRLQVGAMRAAVDTLVAANRMARPRDPNPETWDLQHYIPVAEYLGLIEPDTATQATLAKNFRNLIHPGRAARLGQKCDRATALGALAAVEAVARDLAP